FAVISSAGLPTPALPKILDHPRKSLHSEFPVLLDGDFSTIGIAVRNRIEDLLMLADGLIEFIHNGACIKPPVPLCLRLNGIVNLEKTRPSSRLHNGAMEIQIEFKNPVSVRVTGTRKLSQALVECSKLFH